MRGYAAEALGHLFQMRVAPAKVIEAVRAIVFDSDDMLRWEAVFALGNIGAAQDIAVLERVLAEEIARQTPDTAIVEEAERALDQLRTRIGNVGP